MNLSNRICYIVQQFNKGIIAVHGEKGCGILLEINTRTLRAQTKWIQADTLKLMGALGRNLRKAGAFVPIGERAAECEGLPDFETLLKLYHKRVFSLIYRLVGDPEEVADLTQETFVKAYKAYPRFKGNASAVYPWLCQIAVNSCKNKFKQLERKWKREGRSLDEPAEIGDASADWEVAGQAADPVQALERSELETKIHSAIQALPPEYRTVVVLRDMHELTYQEIAEVTGLNIEAVKVRLFRARRMLRRKLWAYVSE